MDLVSIVTQRWLVVGLAILGAILVMAASGLASRRDPGHPPPAGARLLSNLGYGLTFASIALFIVAGFLSGR